MPSVSKEQIAGFKEFLKGTTLRKQIGTPEEAVAPVLFLASPEASNIIGIDVVVDGGANVV
jgi:NAD(P)-dependent dehydrogenase (short-subunit alcohol dehydrogenase family)